MGASEKGRAGDVYDVRVVAFAGGQAARTREALQELFGLDRESAQRLLDNVPMVVRRAAPANEAQEYADALRGIGARVALELPGTAAAGERSILAKPPPPPGARKAPPPPPRAAKRAAKAPPPVPRDAEPLPKPIIRQPTADLEFELAADGGGAEPAAHGEHKSPTQILGKRAGQGTRQEFEFSDSAGTDKLELDVGSAHVVERDRPSMPSKSIAAQPARMTRPSAAVRGEQPIARPLLVEAGGGAGPMSRAAVVTKTGPVSLAPARRRRTHALLRVLGAVSVAAGGVWLDSSIVYGNANVVSVLVHAVAIYQCGVGLRGMLP